MEQEKITQYANKYRKTQKRISLAVMIFIIIVGIIIVSFGIFFLISSDVKSIVIGVIMVIAGLLDVSLSYKFYKVATKKINSLSDIEAKNRYVKITGKK